MNEAFFFPVRPRPAAPTEAERPSKTEPDEGLAAVLLRWIKKHSRTDK